MTLLECLDQFCFKKYPVEQGTFLMQEGEFPNQVYVMVSGTVKVTTGNVVIGQFNRPGDTYGEMAVILEEKASATVECLTPCEVYIIQDLETFLTKNPTQCINMLKLSYRRLKQMNKGVNIMYDHLNI